MKRVVGVTLVALVTVCGAMRSQSGSVNVRVIRECGRERWPVKILADDDTLLIDFTRPKQVTVDRLTRMRPFSPGDFLPRQWFERTVYVVEAEIYGYNHDADRNCQLFLRDPWTRRTMLAEIPDPDCREVASLGWSAAYRSVRQWVRDNIGEPVDSLPVPVRVRLSGVGLYQRLDDQKGMAENGLELHPVIEIERSVETGSGGPMLAGTSAGGSGSPAAPVGEGSVASGDATPIPSTVHRSSRPQRRYKRKRSRRGVRKRFRKSSMRRQAQKRIVN